MSEATDRSCPRCGTAGRSVQAVTLSSLLTPSAREGADDVAGYRFCATPSCEVAWFRTDDGHVFEKHDVRVRIGLKETASPRPACYCFGHDVESIEREIRETGGSTVVASVTARCRAGEDRCRETNPQGSCCLGNLRRIVKELRGETVGASRPSSSSDACCIRAEVGTS